MKKSVGELAVRASNKAVEGTRVDNTGVIEVDRRATRAAEGKMSDGDLKILRTIR